ncbi:hypothetical protein VNO78_06408 [Psophocarpus tetragonolobus]|uniref:Uncharacterized protein n=1 Tax=Psophocarpus tetragonolobus TaxID=3891 RepID=A0AAN9SV24_PSOTE
MEIWSENGRAGGKREFPVDCAADRVADLEDCAADRMYADTDIVNSERRSDRWIDSLSPPSAAIPANQKATHGHDAQGQRQRTKQHTNRGKYADTVGPAVLCVSNQKAPRVLTADGPLQRLPPQDSRGDHSDVMGPDSRSAHVKHVARVDRRDAADTCPHDQRLSLGHASSSEAGRDCWAKMGSVQRLSPKG